MSNPMSDNYMIRGLGSPIEVYQRMQGAEVIMSETITVTSHVQLNAIIAEKVMGWKWIQMENNCKLMRNPEGKPAFALLEGGETYVSYGVEGTRYSADLNAAGQLIRKCNLRVGWSSWHGKYEAWDINDDRFHALADSIPIAICIAALKLQGVEVNLALLSP